MRTSIIKITLAIIWLQNLYAQDLTRHESTCAELGFKRKTPTFGECVLELYSREKPIETGSKQIEDGSPDHITCTKYGFASRTPEYAQCRLQIDIARSSAQEQNKRYQDQINAQKRARDYERSEATLMMGLGILNGTRSLSNNRAIDPAPPPSSQLYRLPNGRTMTCSTSGNTTNCF